MSPGPLTVAARSLAGFLLRDVMDKDRFKNGTLKFSKAFISLINQDWTIEADRRLIFQRAMRVAPTELVETDRSGNFSEVCSQFTAIDLRNINANGWQAVYDSLGTAHLDRVHEERVIVTPSFPNVRKVFYSKDGEAPPEAVIRVLNERGITIEQKLGLKSTIARVLGIGAPKLDSTIRPITIPTADVVGPVGPGTLVRSPGINTSAFRPVGARPFYKG